MIPTQTLVEYPVFGDESTKVKPENAKYATGFLPGEVLPAQYHNYFLNKSSDGVTTLNRGVDSMEKELNNVVTAGGGVPAENTDNQVISAIQTLIDAAKREAILAAHPVGSLYWTNSTENPSITFGGGTWERIKDKFILAAGDTYPNGVTGGAATVTLTVNQMPSHNHSFQIKYSGDPTAATSYPVERKSTFSGYTFAEKWATTSVAPTFSGNASTTGNNNVGHSHSLNNHTHSFSATTGGMSTHASGTLKGASGAEYYTGAFSQTTTSVGSYGSSGTSFYKINADFSHTHSVSGTTGGNSGSTGGVSQNHYHSFTPTGTVSSHYHEYKHQHLLPDMNNSGEGQSHNNMPPYLVQYCWRRTA